VGDGQVKELLAVSYCGTTEKSNPKRQRGSRHVNDGMHFLAGASGYYVRDGSIAPQFVELLGA